MSLYNIIITRIGGSILDNVVTLPELRPLLVKESTNGSIVDAKLFAPTGVRIADGYEGCIEWLDKVEQLPAPFTELHIPVQLERTISANDIIDEISELATKNLDAKAIQDKCVVLKYVLGIK